jgi:hypothetical protein
LQTDDGHDRHHGVAQRMSELDAPLRDAARPRETDVVGAHGLEHLGANQPHDQRQLEEAERQHRQHQRLAPGLGQKPSRPPADADDVAASERRQPPQLDREHVDQADADQEGRQRYADQRENHHRVGHQPAPVDGGIDAEGDADDEGEQRRQHRELDRRRQALGQKVGHGARLAVRDAEVAPGRMGEESRELDRERIVQAEPFGELDAVGIGRLLAGQARDRIADEAKHGEGDEPHRQNDEDALQQTADQVRDHIKRLRVPLRLPQLVHPISWS